MHLTQTTRLTTIAASIVLLAACGKQANTSAPAASAASGATGAADASAIEAGSACKGVPRA